MLTGEDALKAANALYKQSRHRSSISRSYHAAYSFLTAVLALQSGARFQTSREGPSHASLADQVKRHLTGEFGVRSRSGFAPLVADHVRRDIIALYEARIDADYRPLAAVPASVALSCLKDATTIRKSVRSLHP